MWLRRLIGVFFAVLILEGAVRKWLLPQYGTELFVVKDLVLILALIAYLVGRYTPPRWSDLWIWAAWIAVVLVSALLTGFSFQSLVGLRYYLAPLPILLIVPALLRNMQDLEHFAKWAVWASLPVGILAIIQYNSPVDSFINTYAWGNDGGIATFGVETADFESVVDHARVTGPFSYISTFAAFLAAAWTLAWLSLLHSRRPRDGVLAAIALLLIFVNMGMNGSRSLILYAALSGLPFALIFFSRFGMMRSRGFVTTVIVATAAAVGAAAILRPAELTLQRGDTEEGFDRVLNMVLMPLNTMQEVGWLGEGVGSTFGGYETFGMSAVKPFDEVHVDRVGIELGTIGYVFALVAKLLALVRTVRVFRRAPKGAIRDWCLVAFLVQLNPLWGIPFYNSIAAILFFSALALVHWLDAQIDRARMPAAQSAAAAARFASAR